VCGDRAEWRRSRVVVVAGSEVIAI
jgi:hypothetical protein